jgi:hypothetical protein
MRCFTGGPGPDQVPDGNKVFLVGHRPASRFTRCNATPGGFGWGFVAPRANLYNDHGKLIITHFGGLTWQATDGSNVVGRVEANARGHKGKAPLRATLPASWEVARRPAPRRSSFACWCRGSRSAGPRPRRGPTSKPEAQTTQTARITACRVHQDAVMSVVTSPPERVVFAGRLDAHAPLLTSRYGR